MDGKEGREEIGDGYNVGPGRFRYFHYYFYCPWPGHGMIVWEGADGVRVDQAAGRSFFSVHDPWKPADGTESLNPHLGMKKREKCIGCSKRM